MPPHREGGQAQYVETPVSPRPGRTMAQVLDWARARLDAPIAIETLAERAAMSPRTFLRHFEASVGGSPLAWLQRERMARARELLESTAMPVAQVAGQCGYGSPETFRAAFRRIVGVPPGAYRERFGRGADAVPTRFGRGDAGPDRGPRVSASRADAARARCILAR
jgi:AraC family transcriptional activator FtrA